MTEKAALLRHLQAEPNTRMLQALGQDKVNP